MRRLALFFTVAFGFVGMADMSGTVGRSGALGLMAPALGAPAGDVQKVGEETAGQGSTEPPSNPHGNSVFRATDATSCRDCHAAGRSASGVWPVLDNERVRTLVAKGKGAYVGRFADCFRCHAGGRLPSKQP